MYELYKQLTHINSNIKAFDITIMCTTKLLIIVINILHTINV